MHQNGHVSMAKGCLIPKPTQPFELFRPSIRVRNSSTCLLSSCKSSSLNTLNRVVQVGGYPFCLPFTQYLIASLKGSDLGRRALLGFHCSLRTTSWSQSFVPTSIPAASSRQSAKRSNLLSGSNRSAAGIWLTSLFHTDGEYSLEIPD